MIHSSFLFFSFLLRGLFIHQKANAIDRVIYTPTNAASQSKSSNSSESESKLDS